MSRKKIHRISVYLLDPDRRKVLLFKAKQGPHQGKFVAPAQPLKDTETPMQTIRKLVTEAVDLDLNFISHHTSAPAVIDEHSVRFGAPLFMQLTNADDGHDFVDFVFLAQATTAPLLDGESDVGWFNTEDLIGSVAPKHVKSTVRSILSLFHV